MKNLIPTLGVIVGRFQVAELHRGHRYLIEQVLGKHASVLIVLGTTGGQPTRRNPLDAETRTRMIQARYPTIQVRTLEDHPSNEAWSQALDALITEVGKGRKATLYGSRDSFFGGYSGCFPMHTIAPIHPTNGTDARKRAATKPRVSRAFRQGAIYAAYARLPISYQTVDMVIVRRETGHVLLGRKTGEEKLRFPGGFVDAADLTLEAAARREIYEETGGLEVGPPTYAGSLRIQDHRYHQSGDAILTSVFILPYLFGAPRASDDLAHLEWVRFEDVEARIAVFHLPIWHLTQPQLTATKEK